MAAAFLSIQKMLHLRKLIFCIFINTEDATFEKVDILGFAGYYVERDDGLILTWSSGKYHHIVDADITETSRITKEDIIKIARSRKN